MREFQVLLQETQVGRQSRDDRRHTRTFTAHIPHVLADFADTTQVIEFTKHFNHEFDGLFLTDHVEDILFRQPCIGCNCLTIAQQSRGELIECRRRHFNRLAECVDGCTKTQHLCRADIRLRCNTTKSAREVNDRLLCCRRSHRKFVDTGSRRKDGLLHTQSSRLAQQLIQFHHRCNASSIQFIESSQGDGRSLGKLQHFIASLQTDTTRFDCRLHQVLVGDTRIETLNIFRQAFNFLRGQSRYLTHVRHDIRQLQGTPI